MGEDREKLTLMTIKGGALAEQFDRALNEVINNLADINTTMKPREINLKVKLTPSRDRSFLEIFGEVKTKIEGQESIEATADLMFDDRGRAAAWNRESKQVELPFDLNKARGG